MFDDDKIAELDTAGACAALAATHRDLVSVECQQLALAAHWIDLHAVVDEGRTGTAAPTARRSRSSAPGAERLVRVGAEGTPWIGEFACAEFAALQDLHPAAGRALLAKVANLRDRHPRLWGRVLAGQVRGWKALEVARIVGRDDYALTLKQARWVDAQTATWIDTLPWGAFMSLLEARIIAADPQAADLRRRQAATRRYVSTGRAGEHGLRTFIAQAAAGDVIRLVALCDRIAEILADQGDLDPVDARRATALGIIANPAHALVLLLNAAPADDGDALGDGGEPDDTAADSDGLAPADLHPADDDSDDAANGAVASAGGLFGDDPARLVAALRKLAPGRLDRILPRSVLHIHATAAGLRAGQGAARMEGVGPITFGALQEFLKHSRVTCVQVLDPLEQRPVDGYEFPATTREAAFTLSPRDVFPFAPSTSRRRDVDHPIPYRPPARGGPRGQTRIGNAAPMMRFHHRLKTHAGWQLRQPEPGSYLWRSPHGYFWLTSATGTHPLPVRVGETLWNSLEPWQARQAG